MSLIEVDNLSFGYDRQGPEILHELSFEIDKGEIFGFLGPSGSGKSTTQKLLIGLLNGFSGSINILGKASAQWRHEFYQHIGVGFELPNHFNRLTALENLRLFASFYGKQANSQETTRKKHTSPEQLLEQMGLAESANKPVSAFSKGMKMRLNFARALLNDPSLLFLDEPTAGLDPITARNMKAMIQELKRQGKTIFLTTHNMHDADELCDRVAFITEGRLALIGAPQELKMQQGKTSVEVTYLEQGKPQCKQFPMAGLASNQEFQALLHRVELRSIHSQEASLEDVFVQATGVSLS